MTVLFTALVGFVFFGEKIGVKRSIALLVGFAGVVVLASGKTAGASIGWAVVAGTSCRVPLRHRRQPGASPSDGACRRRRSPRRRCGASTLLLLPFALAQWPDQAITAKAGLAAAPRRGLHRHRLRHVLPPDRARRRGARASTVTYLVPLFGVAWAWLLLGEPLTPTMIAAGVLILGSVAFSQKAK